MNGIKPSGSEFDVVAKDGKMIRNNSQIISLLNDGRKDACVIYQGTLMKTKAFKLFVTAFCMLSLLLLDGCGGSDGDGITDYNTNGDDTFESASNTNELEIEERHISYEDTRPTLDAVAAGVNPNTTLIDDSFYCHNWNSTNFSTAEMLIFVSGNSYSTDVGSGTIQALEGDDDSDIEFRGGPLDGIAVDVLFDNHGQTFNLSLEDRSVTCFQSGANEVAAQLKFKLSTVNAGNYTCRDIDTGKDATLVISDNGYYSLGNSQGSWVESIQIDDWTTTVVFSQGALGGAELSYREYEDSGLSKFEYVTTYTDGLFDNGQSQGPSTLNCWHVDGPVAIPVYGAQQAPQPTPPAVAISGRYVRSVYVGDVVEDYHNADHFWFDANGYVYLGETPGIGLDCSRTRPNGLSFCDTYQFDGSTLTFFSPLGEEIKSYSAVIENGQLVEIGGFSAVPARPATAADLTGIWSNLTWWNFGCGLYGYCDNGYIDRAFAFNDTARFIYTADGISTLGVNEMDMDGSNYAPGTVFSYGSTDLEMAGQVSLSGTTMTLVYDSGSQARHFTLFMNDGHLAIDGRVYTRQ
jgi:hypothetical protein